jgi:glyoxylase-like metal-dependent hydrolase (beta-lactamase superfamily II)/rhodanese-related sulfurtransferase
MQEYKKYLDKNHLVLKAIVDTHTHADHFSLAAVLKNQFKVPVIMHEKAISEVATQRVNDGDEIDIGVGKLKVIYSPGHTDDTINLYTEGMVFTADVLLIGSVGRSDFQNGSAELMFDTLQKLKALPKETIVFPGHDYHEKRSSTMVIEKENNPYLKEESRERFASNMRSKVLQKPFNIDNIIRLNRKGEALSLEMISPEDASKLANKDAQVKFLDVRSVLEFSQTHIKDSINVPIDMLAVRIGELNQANRAYIVLCRTGNRSPMAADMLMQSGIHAVKVMDGGITRWQKERLPVIKGEGGISLERQVRVMAGSIVLFGIILSWFAHPWFICISIFVCCGLIYAGLTDNCMMGMLLMKLPYNKKLYKTKLGGGTCSS